MELRKIQITGGSTHVVSLPKKWVDRSGLGRSDTLAIHEEPDGSLLIVPHADARPRRRKVTLELPSEPGAEAIVRRMVGAYLAGADEIVLRGDGHLSPEIRQIVRQTARDLVGVEILDEEADAVHLQDLVGLAEMEPSKTVTRMHRIARIMFDDAMRALETGDQALGADVTQRDDELDRLEWMVSKQMHALLDQPRLAARLQIRPAEALNLFLVARTVERMGDHASKICKNIPEIHDVPAPLITSLVKQADRVRTIWDDGFAALKRRDFERGSAAVDHGKEIADWRAQLSHALRELDADIVPALTLIADSIDRLRGYAIDIAETAMNQTFHSETT